MPPRRMPDGPAGRDSVGAAVIRDKVTLDPRASKAVLWFDDHRHVLLMAALLITRGVPYILSPTAQFSITLYLLGFRVAEQYIGALCVVAGVLQVLTINGGRSRTGAAMLAVMAWGYFTVGLFYANGIGSPGGWTSLLMMAWSLYAITRSIWWR